MADPLGIGIIGMGFIGQTHARAVLTASERGVSCALRGVCDLDADRRSGRCSAGGNLESAASETMPLGDRSWTTCSDPEVLFTDPAIDLAIICTPTDTHVDIAIRALHSGKHVLVEKPVAIRTSEIERLIDVATEVDRLCIPAMCVRHWPGWSDLVHMVRDERFGRILHAAFTRTGAPPAWSRQFYEDASRSGNAIFDLHIHDADFALHAFGKPSEVRSVGNDRHISTQLIYADGPAVTIEGGWLSDDSVPFRMTYCAEFERATIEYDSSRVPTMRVYHRGEASTIELEHKTGFDVQIQAVVSALLGCGKQTELPSLTEALRVTRLIEAERCSSETGTAVELAWPD